MDIFLVWEFFLKKNILDFIVIVHSINTVDFSEINSCLVITTLLFLKLISPKLIQSHVSFFSYLLLNMLPFSLLHGSVLKAEPLPNKISYTSPDVNSACSAAAEALHCFLLEVELKGTDIPTA